MGMWNPWRGCHKFSEGCKYCYIHKGDSRRGIDTNVVVKTDKFYAPIEKNTKGEYKIKSGQLIYVCFSSDFLIEEADLWRTECWKMIKERNDLHFLFLTKRIERFNQCIPPDWNDGYDNVTVGCTVENQACADFRLNIFNQLPIKHKDIICQPLIGPINLEKYLSGIELVVVGGESDQDARPLDFEWVKDLHSQCLNKRVKFEFRQCGTRFIKDGQTYNYKVWELGREARKCNF